MSDVRSGVNDVIGGLAGLTAESSAALRGHREGAVTAAEESLHALFDVPEHDEAPRATRVLRLLVAARAAHVDGAAEVTAFYLELLEEEAADAVAADSVNRGAANPLHVSPELALALVPGGADGEAALRASRATRALLRHVDLLVQRPAASTPDDLDALTAAGYTVTEIVLLAQIVTFVSYQTRVVHGLRVLQEVAR